MARAGVWGYVGRPSDAGPNNTRRRRRREMSDQKEMQRVQATAGGPSADTTEDDPGAPRALPEDQRLVERLLAGDEVAFTQLIEHYHGPLLRLARVYVSSQAVAEEVVQEAWTGLLRGLPKFEGRSSLKTWIFRILTNRAKTRGVREGRTVPFSSLGDPGPESEPAVDPSRFRESGMWVAPPRRWDSDTPEKLLMQKQAMQGLAAALGDLPASQRAVVTLRDIEQLDAVEVCNVLEISETNQRVLLHRGRSKLRRILEEYIDGA